MSLRFQSIQAVLLGFVISLLIFVLPANATTISPVVVDVDADRGDSIPGTVVLKNTDTEAKTFYVNSQNFVANGEEGRQTFLEENEGGGLASWIVPETRVIRLEPGIERSVSYTVNVPQDAEPGGHYAALFFSTQPENGEGDQSVGIGTKIGVLFLARVSGDIRESANIESFRATNGPVLNRLPVFFELRILNNGNVHFRPEGEIVIRNPFGEEQDRIALNPKNSAVLPGSIRRIDSVWGDPENVQEETGFFTELQNEWRHFAIGRYTAEVHAIYGKSGQELIATQTFWVIPLRVISVVVLGFILLVLLVRGYNRIILHAALKRHSSK